MVIFAAQALRNCLVQEFFDIDRPALATLIEARYFAFSEWSGEAMAKSSGEKLPTVSIGELVEFFDTHDMGDYWDEMKEAHFDIDVKVRKHLVMVDEDLVGKISREARARRVSSEKLVNSLLREKLAEAG